MISMIISFTIVLTGIGIILLSNAFNEPLIIITGLIGALLISYPFWPQLHIAECQCASCYQECEEINEIQIAKGKDNNMYYYNQIQNTYIPIIQEDGTNYTYDEYQEKKNEKYEDFEKNFKTNN